jgi:signal transduction histidine kinase
LLNASTADEVFDDAPVRAHGLIRDVLGLAEGGLAELRALIFELRPESLEREGLVGALEKQVAAVQARHGLHVRMQVAAEPDLPQPTKEAVYRVAHILSKLGTLGRYGTTGAKVAGRVFLS